MRKSIGRIYYAPSDSRFFETESNGKIDKSGDNTKIASSKIKLVAEISLLEMCKLGVEYILNRVNFNDKKTNTGDRSAATNTGYMSAATASGADSIAMAMGYKSKAKASIGSWIVLAEWFVNEDGKLHIKKVRSGRIDGKKLKADTFYKLINNKFVEDEEQ